MVWYQKEFSCLVMTFARICLLPAKKGKYQWYWYPLLLLIDSHLVKTHVSKWSHTMARHRLFYGQGSPINWRDVRLNIKVQVDELPRSCWKLCLLIFRITVFLLISSIVKEKPIWIDGRLYPFSLFSCESFNWEVTSIYLMMERNPQNIYFLCFRFCQSVMQTKQIMNKK